MSQDDLRASKKSCVKVLVTGLDGCGKSTLVQSLLTSQIGGTSQIVPTANVDLVSFEVTSTRTMCTFLDCGGGPRCRQIWPRYLDGADCVLFVVDSTDTDRVTVARNELLVLLRSVRPPNKPAVLVVCSKQDRIGSALCQERVADLMGLQGMLRGYSWDVRGTNAVSGRGISDVLKWVCQKATPQKGAELQTSPKA